MKYTIVFDARALKALDAFDKIQARLILAWIDKNLNGTDDPRVLGTPLKGKLSSYWRYRVGQYRILVELLDKELVIVIITIGQRRDAYK
ncbi:MAG TPA: type II toxin-antitoxin system mRNA interferase toxin, RelE/StbE family [Erysipelotrichaceae bacterium]|nr:type II toxin-antitoxin system mRNA interferase toxin, RelE/StbE family [Erysipelotrichaceae bacterium]